MASSPWSRGVPPSPHAPLGARAAGNSFFPMLVAVVTPSFDDLKEAAQKGGWACDDLKELAAKPEAKKFILDCMHAECKEAKLKTFELPQVRRLSEQISPNLPHAAPHVCRTSSSHLPPSLTVVCDVPPSLTVVCDAPGCTGGHPRGRAQRAQPGLLHRERLPHAHIQAQAAAAAQKVPGAGGRHVRRPRAGPDQVQVAMAATGHEGRGVWWDGEFEWVT